jgi:hypothetical protein
MGLEEGGRGSAPCDPDPKNYFGFTTNDNATYQMRDWCECAGVLDPLRLCAAAQPRAALLNLHNINIMCLHHVDF